VPQDISDQENRGLSTAQLIEAKGGHVVSTVERVSFKKCDAGCSHDDAVALCEVGGAVLGTTVVTLLLLLFLCTVLLNSFTTLCCSALASSL
jgi:hypothetical protein